MSNYRRVLPRDLFNESNLLKCYGQLWIALEGNDRARFVEEAVDQFRIVQNPADGSLTIANLTFKVADEQYFLSRPLNSRNPWPLYIDQGLEGDFEPIAVFDDQGDLTEEMEQLIYGTTEDENTSALP